MGEGARRAGEGRSSVWLSHYHLVEAGCGRRLVERSRNLAIQLGGESDVLDVVPLWRREAAGFANGEGGGGLGAHNREVQLRPDNLDAVDEEGAVADEPGRLEIDAAVTPGFIASLQQCDCQGLTG